MKFDGQESSVLEFKREVPKNDQIIKTMVGFCNQNGGRLVIGVDDDGTIVGVDDAKAQQVLEYVEKSIFDASAPPIIPRVHTQRIGEKTIIVIEVSAGMNKPYFVVAEGLENGTYVRVGRSTMRANADFIEELKWQSRGRSYDTMPVYHATLDDLDQAKIKSFLNARINNKSTEVTNELLRSYFLAIDEHAQWYPTVAGILLFGKDPQHYFSEAMIIGTLFAGTAGREVIATRDFNGTLAEQFNGATDFVLGQLNKSFTIKGMRRTEKLELPVEAVREIILNAVVHRNYHLKAPSKIAIYQDRIEIFSPGNFPGMLDPNNLLQGLSYLRNIAICKVFRELGYIEKLGSGFIATFESYARWGLKTPHVIDGENYVKCILPRQQLVQIKGPHVAGAMSEDERIVALLHRVAEISIADVIENLHVPRATAGKKLLELVQTGELVRIGKGRGTKYRKA